MIFISHRVNTLAALRETEVEHGAEIDLRDHGDRIILQHDPFSDGEDFEPWLAEYRHRTLILNVKSERVELRVKPLLEKYGITDYFFLDSTVPMIFKLSNEGDPNSAARFSEIEPLESVLALRDRIRWVWVDCFTRLPITPEISRLLKASGLKTCLVSPELQGRPEDIPVYRDFLRDQGIEFDAICTKRHNIREWR